MIQDVRTCLWFSGDGVEAADFYVSLLPDSRIDRTSRPIGDAPPVVIEFSLGGTPFMILNVPPSDDTPAVTHRPAASISVTTLDQAETDRLWDALLDGGGEEAMCGWLKDRFGLYWQVVPEALQRLLEAEDRAAAERAQAAMMQMRKIDIAVLEAAFNGK